MNTEQNNRYLSDIDIIVQSLNDVLNVVKESDNTTYPEQRNNLWNLRTLKSICVELGENLDYNINKFADDYGLQPREI